MTKNVFCLRESQNLVEVIEEFNRRNISGAPVVNDEGQVIGLLSRTGMLTHMARLHRRPDDLTVADVMEHAAFEVRPEDSVKSLIETMLPGRVHRMVVVDAGEHPVGIVTSIDLMEAYYESLRT